LVVINLLNDKLQKPLALFPSLDQLQDKLLDKLTLDVLLLCCARSQFVRIAEVE